MSTVTVILTCHNRKNYTEACIKALGDSGRGLSYVVVDDGSTDGTAEMLEGLKDQYRVRVIPGGGNLFWSGGMRRAIGYVRENRLKSDYYLLINDDVRCHRDALASVIEDSRQHNNSVIAGVTEGEDGTLTYGGVSYKKKGIQYVLCGLNEECDTFNCNFVLIPADIFHHLENFDAHYTHAMADFDYGFQIKRAGYKIFTSGRPVGICGRNTKKGTWQDTGLPRLTRFRLKESPKGLPFKEWFYFLRKNFGTKTALFRSLTPYIKIMAGR